MNGFIDPPFSWHESDMTFHDLRVTHHVSENGRKVADTLPKVLQVAFASGAFLKVLWRAMVK